MSSYIQPGDAIVVILNAYPPQKFGIFYDVDTHDVCGVMSMGILDISTGKTKPNTMRTLDKCWIMSASLNLSPLNWKQYLEIHGGSFCHYFWGSSARYLAFKYAIKRLFPRYDKNDYSRSESCFKTSLITWYIHHKHGSAKFYYLVHLWRFYDM